MFQRLKRGGWPYSQPPNVDFDVNWDSEQSEGLVAWWPTLASRGANVLRDLSGRGHNGVFKGPGEPAWVADAERGFVLDFDGTDDRVDAPSVFNPQDAPLSVSMWVYPDSVGINQYFFNINSGAAAACLFWISSIAAARLGVVRTGGVNKVQRSDQNVIAVGSWQHILFTDTGSDAAADVHIYVDGVEVGYAVSQNGVNQDSFDGTWSVGGRTQDDTRNFEGRMADIRVYNRVLSPANTYYISANPWELYRPKIRRLWAMAPGIARIPRPPAAYNTLMIY